MIHATPLLAVSNLRKEFPSKRGVAIAVDDVSFTIARGETVALVGESGCGKSTVAMALMKLIEVDGGRIVIAGGDGADSNRGRRALAMGIVFQNPYSSLNPKMTIRTIVGEPLKTVLKVRGRALTDRVNELLSQVGLSPEQANRYPHQFSGGQRQRIAIARALALEPELLILDEPTASLDVSVQAQVLTLLMELQKRRGLSYLFITHDLATVDFLADRVMVMYLGRIVERGPVADVFADPRHPYTRALLDSVPSIDPAQRDKLKTLSGEIPSLLNRPGGCAFAPRCGRATPACSEAQPALEEADQKRAFACINPLPNGDSAGAQRTD